MLIALDLNGRRTEADEADRGDGYRCPECHDRVMYREGPFVVAHFAHYPGSECWWGAGESQRHLAMKHQLRAAFPRAAVEFEVPLVPGHRADAVINGRYAVECAASGVDLRVWELRTTAYNEAGYPVLWLWDFAVVVGQAKYGDARYWRTDLEHRVPATVRAINARTFGQVYALDGAGRLLRCHFTRVFRGGESFWNPRTQAWDVGGGRSPKTIRRVDPDPLLMPRLSPTTAKTGERLVAINAPVKATPSRGMARCILA